MADKIMPDTNYKVVIVEKGGRYCLRIDELCLFAWGESIPAAYEELMRRKERVIEDAHASDVLERLPPPYDRRLGGAAPGRSSASVVTLLAALVALVLAVAVPIGWGLGKVSEAVRQLSQQIPHGRQFWTRIEHDIEAAADPKNDIDPEKKARLLASLHVLVDRAKPFADELSRLKDSNSTTQMPNPAGVKSP
ncbi:MAG TPA: hypothetical protein VLV50_14595 [Stellaceae bacterium]|nr:hypothetical protein [Stellaceae bacterium]